MTTATPTDPQKGVDVPMKRGVGDPAGPLGLAELYLRLESDGDDSLADDLEIARTLIAELLAAAEPLVTRECGPVDFLRLAEAIAACRAGESV